MSVLVAPELEHPIEIFSTRDGEFLPESEFVRLDNTMLSFINGHKIPVRLLATDSTISHTSSDNILNVTFQSIDKETFGKKYHAKLEGRNLHYLKWHFKVHPLQFLDDGVIIITVLIILMYIAENRMF